MEDNTKFSLFIAVRIERTIEDGSGQISLALVYTANSVHHLWQKRKSSFSEQITLFLLLSFSFSMVRFTGLAYRTFLVVTV